MHRVVVLALDGVHPFELGIPARILGAAVGPDAEPLYEVVTCSADGRPVATGADFAIAVRHSTELIDQAGTLVLPPFANHDRPPGAVAAALSRLPPRARIVSLCTAAYALAALGLLDGRPATTHWKFTDHFQRTFPDVRVDAAALFVDDGEVLTAAGGAAGVDLCLHLVRRDHGDAVANRVARLCVVPPRREGGQAMFIDRPTPPVESNLTATASTRRWALQHLHRPLTLDELAAQANMSVRTFTRRFRADIGMAPGQWLAQQRIARARHLLETTDLPMDRIAAETGIGTTASLRQRLSGATGVSPWAYRRAFRTRAAAQV
ncbi:helix-turn-helix domain-containing protein [Micromonospora sp. D93]|uniref:GlxA family transcriptional regulator n=1 Tax=Micromonospora sp. D93 TaxID=2824886 RepID=UPI001B3708B1|nr:helix-turn-helix domain-containing protein [Micromonospora sp. D93]MBQ1017639.1 helix-turn-helix domain-containing protein [Micromonospora sp. D93]